MADAGWYQDPQDSTREKFFDGQAWTGDSRLRAAPLPQPWQPPSPDPSQAPPSTAWQPPSPDPSQVPPTTAWQPPPPAATWQAPPPTTAWQAPPPAAGWQTPPPAPWQPDAQWPPPAPPVPPTAPSRRRRRPLILALVAVAAVAAGAITWLAWPDDAPELTYQGKPITNPAKVLTTAESTLRSYVHDRHGADDANTRCYFTQPNKPASGTKKTDVGDSLLCGPVLFVDGDTAKAYVGVGLTPDLTSGKSATLTPPYSFNELTPQALDPDVTLVRPDRKSAPPGAGNLTVPTPPPAASNVLTSASLGQVSSPASLTNARMIGKNTGVTLEASGVVPRYGIAEEARSAPSGQKLIAFQLTYSEGDISGSGSGHAELVVDGGTPRSVPETSGGDEWDVVAIDNAASAVLQLRNGGYTQTLSLPDGKPGRSNLAVLARHHRTELLHKSPDVPMHFSNGNGSADVTFHAKATFAALDFWIPGHLTKHPKDPGHAILSVHVTYTDPENPGHTYGFDPQLLRLKLPNGSTIRSRNVAHGNFVQDVFEVPASFTKGTVQITGSEEVEGINVSVRKTVNIAVSIKAG